jgi:hypothetical protein
MPTFSMHFRDGTLTWSITGVPVMPTCGTMEPHPKLFADAVNTPCARFTKLTRHRGEGNCLSASKAYTLSCSVATKTNLWIPWPGMTHARQAKRLGVRIRSAVIPIH